jgi:hypothetical protein
MRRRTQFPGLPQTAIKELLGLQDDFQLEHKRLREEAIGQTTDTKQAGVYAVRYNERVRCNPRAAGLDLTFPDPGPKAQNRWVEVLYSGGGDVRITATRGTVQGVAQLTVNKVGMYYFQADGDSSWLTHPIPP